MYIFDTMPKRKRRELRIIDIDATVKKEVERIAKRDGRSASRQAEAMLKDWLKQDSSK